MKKKLLLLLMIFVLAVSMCACSAKEEDVEEKTEVEEVKEKDKDKEKKKKEEPTPTPEPTEEPTPTPEPIEVVDPEYTDEFTKVEKYEDYASKSATPSETMVWVEGVIDSYDDAGNNLILKSEDGDWAIALGSAGTNAFYDRAKDSVGKNVRVFGKYTGYSDDHQIPVVSFLPKEFSNHAYRMETLDNSFRLTQTDYLLDKYKLATEREYGTISFKIPIELREVETDDTLFYYFGDDVVGFLMLHNEAKQEAEFEGMDDDKILLEYANEYMKNTKLLEKEPTKIKGYPALRLVTTFENDDLNMPMALYSYLIMVDDTYYYFGMTEPYLPGETGKELITDMVGTIKKLDSAEAATEKKEESKKEEDSKKEDETKKESETKTEEEKTVKTGIPPLADLAGLYDVTMTITKPDGTTESETLKDSYFGMNELSAYNATNGSMNLDLGGGLIASMTFSYNSKGKVVFSGILTDGTNSGTISGIQTKSAN